MKQNEVLIILNHLKKLYSVTWWERIRGVGKLEKHLNGIDRGLCLATTLIIRDKFPINYHRYGRAAILKSDVMRELEQSYVRIYGEERYNKVRTYWFPVGETKPRLEIVCDAIKHFNIK